MTAIIDYIRTIPDYPHEGIMFRDLTTLFNNAEGLRQTVDEMVSLYRGRQIDLIAGMEARGFILGGAIAHQLGVGFIPVRKPGKLPAERISQDYTLEYGTATVEIHSDSLQPGQTILIVDDLLATGGTAEAGIKLVERLGGKIAGVAVVVDLPDLGGSARLARMGVEVNALCSFAGE